MIEVVEVVKYRRPRWIHISSYKKNTLAGAFLRWHNDRTTPILAMCGNGSSWGPNFGKKNYMSSRKTIRTIRRSTMPLAGFFCIHMCTNTPSFAEGDVLGGAGIYPAPCWWEWWHNSRDWLAPEVVIFQVSKIGDVTHSSMNQIFKNLLRNCHLHPWKLGVPMVDSPKQWTFSMNNKFLLQMFLEQITTSDQSPQIGVRWIACVFLTFWKDSWSQMRMKKWWNQPFCITKNCLFSSNPELGS